MAYQTRRSSGNWMTVSRRSDYGAVVSNYASAIKAAQEASNTVELQNKVLNYKNGLLSYVDLKAYLSEKLATASPGSQKELDFRELMFDLEEYDNKKKKDIERALLEAKFSSNGISAEERLTIEKEMLKFSKEGTPDHTEQLAVIAEAGELRRVETNNSKISSLQSKLSEGGLSTDEQIEIMKETLKLTDKGTSEYAEISTKLGELKEEKKLQENEAKMNEEVSALLDSYAEGGLDNEELLEINRTMQKYYDPGTEEYIDLKQKEADILGEVAKGSGQSQEEAQLEQYKVDYQAAQGKEEKLKKDLASGAITLQKYMEEIEKIYPQLQDLIELTDGEAAGGAEAQGNLQLGIEDYTQKKELLDSGEYVALRVKEGAEPELVPIKDLEKRAEIIEDFGSLDENGNFVSSGLGAQKVVTLDINGKKQSFVIAKGANGELVFEEIEKRDNLLQGEEDSVLGAKIVGVKTGLIFHGTPGNLQTGKPLGLGGVSQVNPNVPGELQTGEQPVDLSSPGLTVSKGGDKSGGDGGKSGSGKKSGSKSPKIDFTPVKKVTSSTVKFGRSITSGIAQGYKNPDTKSKPDLKGSSSTGVGKGPSLKSYLPKIKKFGSKVKKFFSKGKK